MKEGKSEPSTMDGRAPRMVLSAGRAAQSGGRRDHPTDFRKNDFRFF